MPMPYDLEGHQPILSLLYLIHLYGSNIELLLLDEVQYSIAHIIVDVAHRLC